MTAAKPSAEDASGASAAPAGGAGFLFGYVVAQVGAFLAFLPLLQILLPLKAAEAAGAGRVQLLGVIAALGALAGGLANLAAGHLSDHTRSRFGRRRPWLVSGALATATSYGLIWSAHHPAALILSVILFQVAFNVLFAPLVALTPDRVPLASRGWVSGLLALGHPLGLVIGNLVIGALITDEGWRFAALALMVLAATVPFALVLDDPPWTPRAAAPVAAVRAEPASRARVRNFWLGWVGRAFAVAALSIAQTYLLFYLQDALHFGRPGLQRPERGVAELGGVFGLLCVAAALVAGRLSDRLGRRRMLVIAGALAMALGMIGLALARDWPAALFAYAVFGLGAGVHTAVDFALMTELLPSRDRPARDLAILNLSNIAPQVAAPLLGGLLVGLPGADIRWIFAAGGSSAVLAATAVALMRGVR